MYSVHYTLSYIIVPVLSLVLPGGAVVPSDDRVLIFEMTK